MQEKQFFMEYYICGTKFQKLADVHLQANGNHIGDINGKVVYCHTHDLKHVVGKIREMGDIVLITHNSDGAVKCSKDGDLIGVNDADYSLKPSNVKMWFAQNIDCELNNKTDLVPLPIGLENRYCFDYDKAEMLYDKYRPYTPNKTKIYVNFNLRTNPLERNTALNACIGNPNKEKFHIRMGSNGERYNEYIDDINSCTHVLSPRGNGLDCHRTWEALYLGRTPILKKNDGDSISHLMSGLPCILLNNWDEIYTKVFNTAMPNIEPFLIRKLWMPYWRNFINHAKNKLSSSS